MAVTASGSEAKVSREVVRLAEGLHLKLYSWLDSNHSGLKLRQNDLPRLMSAERRSYSQTGPLSEREGRGRGGINVLHVALQ